MVASIHSNFNLPRDEMTKRLVTAASNPRVTMLGHPTGRLLLARDGYAVDLDAVIDAAAAAGTMIEINANPHRLDLDATHCRRARQKGVTIVINPDAHSVGGLDDLEYGVSVARRGWLTKGDVWNTGSLADDGPPDRAVSESAAMIKPGINRRPARAVQPLRGVKSGSFPINEELSEHWDDVLGSSSAAWSSW